MQNIYLTEESKKYYRNDFMENVISETNQFWKLNETLKTHIIELNKCLKIQPLYSKFPENDNSKSNYESYFKFAYNEEIELFLFRKVLPYFISEYNIPFESKFYYLFFEPTHNANFKKQSNFKMGCIVNPDYFRINHLHLVYENHNHDKHIEFWDDMMNKFKAFLEKISNE